MAIPIVLILTLLMISLVIITIILVIVKSAPELSRFVDVRHAHAHRFLA